MSARFQRLGHVLGYPQCCIDHFSACVDSGIRPKAAVGEGPWEGSGFMPCPTHADRIRLEGMEAFVAREIAPNRDPRIGQFPNHGQDDALLAIAGVQT